MTASSFRRAVAVIEATEKAGEGSKKGGQDTSRTPKSPKAEVFQRFGAGASVGARAARKEKTKDFNAEHGTMGLEGRKTVRP